MPTFYSDSWGMHTEISSCYNSAFQKCRQCFLESNIEALNPMTPGFWSAPGLCGC